MAGDPITWAKAAEAGFAAYEHRNAAHRFLRAVVRKVIGAKTTIAFTGMPGVGKSVLKNALTPGSISGLPPQSHHVENGGRLLRGPDYKKRLKFLVLPGQQSRQRGQAEEHLFGDACVDGIVHVVSYGLPEIRGAGHRKQLSRDGLDTLAKFRAAQLQAEITELDQTCYHIERAHNRNRKPSWMILAVSKLDLFWDQRAMAESYYGFDGPFVKRLSALERSIGTRNFSWVVVPVCAHPQEFRWNDEVLVPQLQTDERDKYLQSFLDVVGNYCE